MWEVYTYSPAAVDLDLRDPMELPYEHNQLPFVDFPYEIKDKGWFSPRGVCEILAAFELSMTAMWNHKHDAMTLYNRPLFRAERELPNSINLRFQPGQILPYGVAPVQMPQMYVGKRLVVKMICGSDGYGNDEALPIPDSKVKDIVYHGVTKGREAYNNILQNGFLTINKSNWSNNKDKEFKGVFFTDVSTATSYGVNLERELRPEEKDFVIPAVLNVETLLTPKMGLVSGTVTKLRNENSDIQNLGIQGEEGSEGVHENTVVFEPEQIHILGGKQDIEGFKEFVGNKK